MVKIFGIEMMNFLSFECQTLRLDRKGPTLVLGQNRDNTSASSNGSGKSAIFEAIVWGLYGQTLRGLAQRDVVRKGSTGGCVVSVSCMKGESAFVINRFQDHPKHKNSLILQRCGKEINLKDKRKTQEKIDEILGMDFKLFCQSVVVGQDSLSFSQATDAEKKRIFESIAGIDVFLEYQERAKARYAELMNSSATCSTALDGLNDSTAQSKTRLDELRLKEKGFDIDRKRRVEALKAEAKPSRDVLQLFDSSTKALIALELSVKQDGGAAQTALQNAVSVFDLTEQKFTVAKIEHRYLDDEFKRETQALDDIAEVCYACKRPFDAASIKSAKNIQREKIEGVAAKLKTVKENVLELDKAHALAKQVVLSCTAEVDKINEVKEKIARLKIENIEFRAASEKAQSLEIQIQELEQKPNEFKQLADDEAKQLRMVVKKVADTQKKREELDEETKYVEFWTKGFGKKGIPSYILDHVANFLTAKASEYSQILTDGVIQIVFTTQRQLADGSYAEDFQVNAFNRSGGDVYRGNSVGERQRVDCAVVFALRDLIRSRTDSAINLFVCDEAAANLDGPGSERMMSVLSKEAAAGMDVFYVTHSPRMQELFSSKIEVIKEGGVSRINDG